MLPEIIHVTSKNIFSRQTITKMKVFDHLDTELKRRSLENYTKCVTAKLQPIGATMIYGEYVRTPGSIKHYSLARRHKNTSTSVLKIHATYILDWIDIWRCSSHWASNF